MRKKLINAFMCILILFSMCNLPVQASAIVVTGINNLKTLVVSIVAAIGVIVLIWGVFEWAIAWQQHDSAQITQALKKVVAGLIMIGIGSIVGIIAPSIGMA